MRAVPRAKAISGQKIWAPAKRWLIVVMLDAMKPALAARHKPWLTRYDWFVDLVNDLLDDRPGKPLDG